MVVTVCNLQSLSYSLRGCHKIRHFVCERDLYVLQNHMYKTYFKQSTSLQELEVMRIRQFQTNKTLIAQIMSYLHDIETFERN